METLVSSNLLCWNIRGEWATAFSSNPHKSSQVDEQTKVLLKEDSWQMKVYSQAVFPQVQQHWHLFVDTGWKGKMCDLALATCSSKNFQRYSQTLCWQPPGALGILLLLQILGERSWVETHLLPQCTVSAQAQTAKASNSVFHHSLGFPSVLWDTIIPVLPKIFSPSFSFGDVLPLYRKLTSCFVQCTRQLLSFLFMHSGWHLYLYRGF